MSDHDLYTRLASTAKEFLLSTSAHPAGSNTPDPTRIHARLAPTFRLSWGHTFFVSQTPPLQGAVDGDGFVAHLHSMAPALRTWWIEVTGICVDVGQRCAVVRGDFSMVAKGGKEEPVVNDVVMWVGMDKRGEKVVRAVEFVDPVASAELKGRIAKL